MFGNIYLCCFILIIINYVLCEDQIIFRNPKKNMEVKYYIEDNKLIFIEDNRKNIITIPDKYVQKVKSYPNLIIDIENGSFKIKNRD